MHPLNLWPLPGRLGRTFQVTNKGLFAFVPPPVHFTHPHPSRAVVPTSPGPSQQPSRDAYTWGCTMGWWGVERSCEPNTGFNNEIWPIGYATKKPTEIDDGEIQPDLGRTHAHALFIIRKRWRDRFVRSQGAEQRIESVKAMLRYAHLVIGRVGRWVGRKKGHWRLILRHPPSALLPSLPLSRQRSYIKTTLAKNPGWVLCSSSNGVGPHRSSIHLSSKRQNISMRNPGAVLYPPRSATSDKKERVM